MRSNVNPAWRVVGPSPVYMLTGFTSLIDPSGDGAVVKEGADVAA